MSKACWAVVLGVALTAVWGCGGGESNQAPNVQGNNQPAGAPQANAGNAAPAGQQGTPDPNKAAGQATSGDAADSAAGGPTGDMYALMPSTLKMAVGATIPNLQKKDNPIGESLLSQMRPVVATLAAVGVTIDQIDRVWAGSNRDAGDMLVCVRTRGTLNTTNLVKGLNVSAKPEKVGRASLYALPDNANYKNAVALVDTKTALVGRRSTVEAALKGGPAGAVRQGWDSIASSRPFYWMAGDDSFGQKYFEKSLFGMLKMRTADGIKLNSQGFAMGFSEAGATQGDPGASGPQGMTPNSAVMPAGSSGPPGMGPMGSSGPPGMGPPGMGPPGMGPMGNPMGGTPSPMDSAMPGMTGQQPQQGAASSSVELVLAATFNSEALVNALEDDLKELFKLADAADIARQQAAAAAKQRQPTDPGTEDPMGGTPQPPGGGPPPGGIGGKGGPPGGMPPGGMPAGGMPPGSMPPGGMPGPMGGMPGQGQQSSSTIVHPRIVKEKVRIKLVRGMTADEKEQAKTLGWFGSFTQVAGFAPINDGIFQGTLEIVAGAMRTWASTKPGEYKGAVAVQNAGRFAHHSWMTQLLPYLGREDIYVRIDFKKSPLDPKNLKHAYVVIPEFLNPGCEQDRWTGYPLEGMGLTHYVGMSGVEVKRNDVAAMLPRTDPKAGIFGYDEIAKPAAITDGAAQTIMLIGSDRVYGAWILGGGSTIRGARVPYFGEFSGFSSAGLAKPGAVVLFADGSSRVISADIDGDVFKALCTIHGQETVDMGKVNLAESQTPPLSTSAANTPAKQ